MPMRKLAKKKPRKKKAKKAGKIKVWSARDIAYLRANYKGRTATQISKALGRTVNAVRAKAASLHLKKGVVRKAAVRKAAKRRR